MSERLQTQAFCAAPGEVPQTPAVNTVLAESTHLNYLILSNFLSLVFVLPIVSDHLPFNFDSKRLFNKFSIQDESTPYTCFITPNVKSSRQSLTFVICFRAYNWSIFNGLLILLFRLIFLLFRANPTYKEFCFNISNSPLYNDSTNLFIEIEIGKKLRENCSV